MINAGDVLPGIGAGILTINGNYTQTLAGSLNIETGGLGEGLFDRLAVSGITSYAGTLNVSPTNGYLPNNADTFSVVTHALCMGQFDVVNVATFGAALHPDPNLHGVSPESRRRDRGDRRDPDLGAADGRVRRDRDVQRRRDPTHRHRDDRNRHEQRERGYGLGFVPRVHAGQLGTHPRPSPSQA